MACPIHPIDFPALGCNSCFRQLLRARQEMKREIAEKDSAIAEKDSAISNMEEEIAKKDGTLADMEEEIAEKNREIASRPSLEEIVAKKESLVIYDYTASSSHVYTTHGPATVDGNRELPSVTLPQDFWKFRPTLYLGGKEMSSESMVETWMYNLFIAIIEALKLENVLGAVQNASILDTAADVSLVSKPNHVVIGSVEVKKPPKSENERNKMFGSDTRVAGEVFEQLYLTTMQTRVNCSVGILSCGNLWQLVSLKDIDNIPTLNFNDIVSYFLPGKTDEGTPTKASIARAITTTSNTDTDRKDLRPLFRKKRRARKRRKPTAKAKSSKRSLKQAPRQAKRGRVAIDADQERVERLFYGSRLYQTGTAHGNVKVIEMLVIFILRALQNLKESIETAVDFHGTKDLPCRVLNLTQMNLSLSRVEVCAEKIDWNSWPSHRSKVFHILCQLGWGAHGVCCFGLDQKKSPVVVKFFNQGVEEQSAVTECLNWQTVYRKEPWLKCVQLHTIQGDRRLLLMPYLQIPHNEESRQKLIQNGKESLLYKGLEAFAQGKYEHLDLKWHHVGIFGNTHPPQLYFCDLEQVVVHEGDGWDADQWVLDSFNYLVGRIGDTGATDVWSRTLSSLHGAEAALQSVTSLDCTLGCL